MSQGEEHLFPYSHLEFPAPPNDRPYVLTNMVATIDGKTISGRRDEPVHDLGSATDHKTMRRIQANVDAVLLGAGSYRSTLKLWYPQELTRIVATKSGNIDANSRFFADAPARAYVICPGKCQVHDDRVKNLIRAGLTEIDWVEGMRQIRHELGIRRLLVEGGSELNGALFALDLVDEAFLTIAPKMKLGSDVPTYAGGKPLDRSELLQFQLLSCLAVGDEVFLRYRRTRAE